MKSFRRRAYVKVMRTVKRKAQEGERVIIVKTRYTKEHSNYGIGDIFIIEEVFSTSVYTTTKLGLWEEEYEIVV